MKQFTKKVFGILLLATSMILAGCGTSSMTLIPSQINELIAQIQPGTSQEQVLKLLGNPNNKRILNGQEIWQYSRTPLFTGVEKIIEVGFENGYVQYLNTFDRNSQH